VNCTSITRPNFLDFQSVFYRMQSQNNKDLSERSVKHFVKDAYANRGVLREIMGGHETLVYEQVTPDGELQAHYSACFHTIALAYFSLKGIYLDADLIRQNKTPDGAKLSRFLLRNMPRFLLRNMQGSITYGRESECFKELQGLPSWQEYMNLEYKRRNEVFLQVFYDNLSRSKTNYVLTCDPLELLCASEFTSGWSSCYTFNGRYGGSPSAMARNKFTLMAYTFSSDVRRKTGRFWIHLDLQNVLRSVLRFSLIHSYGLFPESLVTSIRRELQGMLSTWQGIENKWKFTTHNCDRVRQYADGPAPYRDSPFMLVRHASLPAKDFAFAINHSNPTCFVCGNEHDTSEFICSDCDEESICSNCNEAMNEDNSYSHGGEYYCEHCYYELFSNCNHCGDVEPNDDMHYIDGRGESVCSHCLNRHYSYCHVCGEYFPNDEVQESPSGRTVCDDCFNEKYVTCEDCGKVMEMDDACQFDGSTYCEVCLDDHAINCADCGELIAKENEYQNPMGGTDMYCEDCFSAKFGKCDECGEWFKTEDLTETPSGDLCWACGTNMHGEDDIENVA
jgi:formylmethanofuran dehydrogenase subunit E